MYTYIGIVVGRQQKQVYIRPLYKIHNAKAIEPLTMAELAALCLNGLVHWDQAPSYVYLDSWWLFDISGGGLSKTVSGIKPLGEAIDVRGSTIEKPDSILQKLAALPLPHTPSRNVYVLIENMTWAGPLSLARYNQGDNVNMWRYDVKSLDAYVPLYTLTRDHLITFKEAPSRYFISPLSAFGQPIGYMRIANGSLVASTQKITGLSPSALSQVMSSVNVSEEITVPSTSAFSSGQSQPMLAISNSQTIGAHVKESQNNTKHAAENVALNMQIQLKRQELERLEQRIVEAKETKKQGLTAWELAILEEEITEKEQIIKEQFRALEQQYQLKQEALSIEIAALDRQLEAHKSEYQYQLNKMKQELAIERKAHQQALQETIPSLPTGVSQHEIKASNATPVHHEWSWTQPTKKGTAALLNEPDMVLQHLKEACEQHGLPFSTALSVHATLLAGGVPVLAGEGAFEILETYASCVTAGRAMWLPITSTMLEPADLVGKLDPTTKQFLPQAAGLADLLIEAKQQKDVLYLVVLDGINRAAVEYYLKPLLTLYHEYWLNKRFRSYPLFHTSAVVESDPYAGMAQMYWPQNILITATLSDGMAVIPPPASFWNNAALIDLDIIKINPGEKGTTGKHLSDSSEISASTWLKMHEHLKKRATMISLDDADRPAVVGNDQGPLFSKMIYRALCEYLQDNKKASDTFTVQVMMPRALATDTEGTLVRTLKNESKGMKHMIQKIEQFIR